VFLELVILGPVFLGPVFLELVFLASAILDLRFLGSVPPMGPVGPDDE